MIFGFGGADKIIGARGDDLIDPGIWTKGKYDSISGGRGADTFVLKDGYFAFIKDFRVIEDKLDVTGLSQGFDWDIRSGNTYIYSNKGYEVAKIRGIIDLAYVKSNI